MCIPATCLRHRLFMYVIFKSRILYYHTNNTVSCQERLSRSRSFFASSWFKPCSNETSIKISCIVRSLKEIPNWSWKIDAEKECFSLDRIFFPFLFHQNLRLSLPAKKWKNTQCKKGNAEIKIEIVFCVKTINHWFY